LSCESCISIVASLLLTPTSTHGDSWATKTLAGVTLAAFTGILAFFAIKIWLLAKRSKETEGDVSLLYEDKKTWIKYSLFYDSYKKNYWWAFLPLIIYMFTKGVVLAATDGHGMPQTIAQLVIEGLMLIFLLFSRPYERRSGNIINIVIQVVRALSVICILVFVERKLPHSLIPVYLAAYKYFPELGIAQTTQTITGVVLIAVQAFLTGILAILLIVNAFIICCRVNPHRKRRKEAEKLNRDLDNLTPLDARNSLLKGPANRVSANSWNSEEPKYPLLLGKGDAIPDRFVPRPPYPFRDRGVTPLQDMRSARILESREGLVEGAAPLAGGPSGSPNRSPLRSRERVPSIPGYAGYRGLGY
jgi:Transient receptor potential (TRP) ion channel